MCKKKEIDILVSKLNNLYIYDINKIIKIQSLIRAYLIRKYILISSSQYQTKFWRKNRKWYINGKSNECEKYQVSVLEKILKVDIFKTKERINIESLEICNNRNPFISIDGFDWSEDFDRKNIINNDIFYYNLKFVCDRGGSQTRTLREVYHFIKSQLEYLIKQKTQNIYFINILDGDTCYDQMEKFLYLINKDKYKVFNKYIFCGDMKTFQIWYSKF